MNRSHFRRHKMGRPSLLLVAALAVFACLHGAEARGKAKATPTPEPTPEPTPVPEVESAVDAAIHEGTKVLGAHGPDGALGMPIAGFEGGGEHHHHGESEEEEEDEREALEEEEKEVSTLKWGIVIGLMCLAVTYLVGHYLESIHFPYLPEAGVAVLLGILASAVFYVLHGEMMLGDMKFDFEFFMIWLLPPIIFEAGYNMNRQAFFANLFPTVLYAFIGTLMSTFVVGGIVWQAGKMGISHPIGGLAALTFGSLISATDPVTVLAVFQALGVKVDLFSMVFGESVMNDAVAIVLSRTLLGFKYVEVSAVTVGAAVGLFLKIFIGSLLIGMAFGFLSAYVYKHAGLWHHEDSLFVEAAMIATYAWGAYYTAEAFELSGIVAILFCGIVMAKYTRDNLSKEAQTLTARQFKVVALLAETFVFVYLGMAAFAFPIWNGTTWKMIGVSVIACALGRTHIYLFSFITNMLFRRSPDSELPPISTTYMHVMWFSGLRGGVAFAISAVGYQHNDFPANDDSLAIMQTTLILAALTIFLMGGTITDIAKATGILEDKNAPRGVGKRRATLKEGSLLGNLHNTHLRRVFTVNQGSSDSLEDDYDEGCRSAAVTIQRHFRKNSPSQKEFRKATAKPSKSAMSTEDFKASLEEGQFDKMVQSASGVSAEHSSMEDKVDQLRLMCPGASSDELRKILKACDGDISAAAKEANKSMV